jgi:hypothetical protein
MHSEKTSADHLEKIRRLEEQIQDFESLESALETIWSASRVEEVLRRINEPLS